MTVPVAVGFVLTAIAAACFFALWWGNDTDLRDHAERLERVEQALNLGGEPRVLVDPPATEPMERIDLVGGARTAVAAARDANKPRPVPFPRSKGAHRA